MKKVLIGIVVMILLTACGVKTRTAAEKRNLIYEVYQFEDEPVNMEAKAKLDKIMGDLEKKAAKGNTKAAEELESWKNHLPIKQINKKANTRDGKW